MPESDGPLSAGSSGVFVKRRSSATTVLRLVVLAVGASALAALLGGGFASTGTLVLLIAGALGAAYLAWNVDPAWTLSLGIALTMFSGNWEQLGLPPLDRVVVVVGVLAALVRVGRGGLPPFKPVHALMALASSYAIVSAWQAGTLGLGTAQFGLLDRYGLIPFALFALAPIVFFDERRRGILLGVFTIMGGYLGLTALFERLDATALVFPSYILDPEVGIHADRVRGPFVEATALGSALIICAIAAGLGFARWKGGLARCGCLLVIGLCVLGALFTVTRSVWIAAAFAAAAPLLMAPSTRRLLVPVGAASALLVVGALSLMPDLTEQAEQRRTEQLPVWDRQNLSAAAIRMIDDRPMFGSGWGTFETASKDYFRQGEDYPQRAVGLTVHNVFLWNAAELGLVGFVLWLAALIVAVGGAILLRGPPELYPWRVGLVGVAGSWVVIAMFAPHSAAFSNYALWTWAGIAGSRWLLQRSAESAIGVAADGGATTTIPQGVSR